MVYLVGGRALQAIPNISYRTLQCGLGWLTGQAVCSHKRVSISLISTRRCLPAQHRRTHTLLQAFFKSIDIVHRSTLKNGDLLSFEWEIV
jgi:hypothetical protein